MSLDKRIPLSQPNPLLALTTELLESRQLLAGAVAVGLTAAGDLVLQGDNASNSVEVYHAGNHLRIRGSSNTTFVVNGVSMSQIDLLSSGRIERDLRITMRGGDDIVSIRNVDVSRHLRVDLGADTDGFTMTDATVGRDARVRGGGGLYSDLVQFARVQFNNDLRVNVGGCRSDSYTVQSSDTVGLYTVDVSGDLSIRSGAGGSFVTVNLGTKVAGRTSINTGSGDDGLTIFAETGVMPPGNNLGTVRINMGSGDDFAHIDYLVATAVSLKMGAQNDIVELSRCNINQTALIDGGSGMDTLSEAVAGLDIRRFETHVQI